MTEKEAFQVIIEDLFIEYKDYIEENFDYAPLAYSFFEKLRKNNFESNSKASSGMTENGSKVLTWMQENEEKMSNLFTSKEIAEALFTSGRSISGSMRKLVNDGYVEKIGKNPIQYSLTETGKNYQFEN